MRLWGIGIIAIVVAALAGAAGATSLITAGATSLGTAAIRFDDLGACDVANPRLAGTDFRWVYTGLFQFEVDTTVPRTGEGAALTIPPGGFAGFCIQLEQPATDLSMPYQVVPLADVLTPFGAGGSGTGQERALLMQNLWATHFEPAWQMGSSWTTPQRLRAEAFAAALWEIVYETPANGFDVTTGRVRIGSIDTSTANAWLRGLDPNGPQTLLRALSNGQYQDYVTAIPGVGGMQPIGGHAPEPVTLAGLLLGIGTVARYVRRRTARPGPPSRRCT